MMICRQKCTTTRYFQSFFLANIFSAINSPQKILRENYLPCKMLVKLEKVRIWQLANFSPFGELSPVAKRRSTNVGEIDP